MLTHAYILPSLTHACVHITFAGKRPACIYVFSYLLLYTPGNDVCTLTHAYIYITFAGKRTAYMYMSLVTYFCTHMAMMCI